MTEQRVVTTRDGTLGPVAGGALGLLVVEPMNARFVPLAGTRLVLGRDNDCDIVLADDMVSRRHAYVFGTDPPVLEDAGSRHGTRVAADVLREGQRRKLAVGDVFIIGRTYVSLQPAPPASQPKKEALTVPPGFVVRDERMLKILETVHAFAQSRLPILIEGETGSGKELFAEAVHRLSDRASAPLLKLNCTAIPETMLEAELFGFERGAFTNAVQAKPGLIETADGGTLFLDEIADMSPSIQAKLLRVLESGEVTRLGAMRPKLVDVRLVSATHKSTEQLVADGTFRADLFYRICGAKIRVPPLRERPNDITALALHFLEENARSSSRIGIGPTTLAPDADAMLRAHSWPGNVRELRTTVLRAALLAKDSAMLEARHLELQTSVVVVTTNATSATSASPQDAERARIEAALEKCGHSQKRAAELLGISRRTLLRRLDDLGIARPRKQSNE